MDCHVLSGQLKVTFFRNGDDYCTIHHTGLPKNSMTEKRSRVFASPQPERNHSLLFDDAFPAALRSTGVVLFECQIQQKHRATCNDCSEHGSQEFLIRAGQKCPNPQNCSRYECRCQNDLCPIFRDHQIDSFNCSITAVSSVDDGADFAAYPTCAKLDKAVVTPVVVASAPFFYEQLL